MEHLKLKEEFDDLKLRVTDSVVTTLLESHLPSETLPLKGESVITAFLTDYRVFELRNKDEIKSLSLIGGLTGKHCWYNSYTGDAKLISELSLDELIMIDQELHNINLEFEKKHGISQCTRSL